jgi:hypothetical protein
MTHTDAPYPVKGTTAKKCIRGRSGLDWVWRECGLPEDVIDPIGISKGWTNGMFHSILLSFIELQDSGST